MRVRRNMLNMINTAGSFVVESVHTLIISFVCRITAFCIFENELLETAAQCN